jgi:hypothetical protein
MTKTQQNRITTSIMNLWVKSIGQLTIWSVALFFFISCKEDVAELGYPNPNKKFKVLYAEIPLESSVLLRDSLRTSNFYYSGEPNRFLVGGYQDERFGKVMASTVTQFFTTAPVLIDKESVYDSVSLQLQFDLYHYGSSQKTSQSLLVYKLEDVIKFDNLKNFFNKTTVNTGELLGSKSFTINPSDFDTFARSSADYDTVITVKIPLSNAFGRDLFNVAVKWRDYATPDDSVFVHYSRFVEQFKGLVIKPDVSDKAIGFAPSASGTRVLVHYHTPKDTTVIGFGMSGVISFNQIDGDRSASELAQVQAYHQEYLQTSDTRYVQSGTGVLTRVDFGKFFEFIDTIPNILINSAEMVVENVESNSYPVPPSLVLRNLKPETNRFRRYTAHNVKDSSDYVHYRGYFPYDIATADAPALVDSDLTFYARGDKSGGLTWSSSKSSYSGVFTLLLQQMTVRTDDRTPLKAFVLYPGSDLNTIPAFRSGAKSLNRAVFPKSGIKLKVYYTKPLDVQ